MFDKLSFKIEDKKQNYYGSIYNFN